ncbi:EAL domain-containing protein [uncultured Desulfuromusa sp.]|uniref:two-component system response regulator n=1 Tax=uncultured Desulfuromusa sp. TaxID=219183 RepID=UPI002AA7ABA0|nr:EAL domain-containing protein [uncultured Desulfuromusa sp.]
MNTNETNLNAPLILIVDDEIASRLLMCASLKKAGFRVAEAEDGLMAVKEFESLQPDAVLLDVMMPKLDGFDTCRAIRKLKGGENTPILMVTGLDDIEAINKAFNSGATDFITKPINWTVLNFRIKYMLRASDAFYDVINKQKQIQKLAFFDHLTGLANRSMFKDTLEIALAESAKEESQLAVLFMDLDRFKTINDTLGHHVGDYLLKGVAERISYCIREADVFSRLNHRNTKHYVSRLGGDEFTIMLPRLKNPEDAGLVARRIKERLADPFLIDNTEIYISTSIGISIFPLDGTDAEVLMKHADLAMYHAKEKGKNNFQFYKKALNVKARERLDFENTVRKAVKQEQFELYYQPQIDLNTGSIIGAEALTRWNHPQHGAISPAKFIPAIEELGLIVPFTDWVIRQVGKDRLAMVDLGVEVERIAINISSKQFTQQKIPQKINDALQPFGLNPQFLELELTESVLAHQDKETLAILSQIKEMGMSISVDDFGTGYSSMVYLKSLPIDVVKIDRFFIKDLLVSRKDAAIVKAIISMAHSMEMKVIAEGIEKHEQYEVLKTMGCDYGQGFLFSAAITQDEFSKTIYNNEILMKKKVC